MRKKSSLLSKLLALSALGLLFAAVGCSPRPSANQAGSVSPQAGAPGIAAIDVQAVPVSFGALVVEHNASVTVMPVMQSQVVGQLSGVVARVLRKPGDWVDRNATVIQLDDSQLKLAVQTAQASLENARITLSTGQDATSQANPRLDLQVRAAQSALSAAQSNYDSRKALFKLEGATSADVDRAKSDLDTAQANLEAAKTALDQNRKADVQNIAQLKLAVEQAGFALQQAQLNLQFAAIKAPYAGHLVAVNVMPGELVSQNAAAFVIASSEREIDFDVPPADAAGLPVGALVTFTLNGASYALKVSQSPQVPQDGVVHTVAAVPDSLSLAFGAVGTVSYSPTLARGALIPTGALQTNEDKNFVYLVQEGKARVHPITILAESGSSIAVTGVDPGSLVAVNPPPGLLDGSSVKAQSLAGSGGGQ
jgi:multidrug efflux pump subunit AcrA (membrane-fusion protein)